MKKNEVFTFTAPNGVEVTAVVISKIGFDVHFRTVTTTYLCYAQNRLFTCIEKCDIHINKVAKKYGKVLVDYAILPDYDELIQLHSSMQYPQWEQNLEAEIQGINDR